MSLSLLPLTPKSIPSDSYAFFFVSEFFSIVLLYAGYARGLLLTTFITFTLFSLFLSSCDGKNASLINKRTATPERVKEIEEALLAALRELVNNAHLDVSDADRPLLINILRRLGGDDRSLLIDILTGLNGDHINDRSLLIYILYGGRFDDDDNHLLIDILHRLGAAGAQGYRRTHLIDVLKSLIGPNFINRSDLIGFLSYFDVQDDDDHRDLVGILIDLLYKIPDPDDRIRLINIGFILFLDEYSRFLARYDFATESLATIIPDITTLIPDITTLKNLPERLERRRHLLAHPKVHEAIQEQED